MTDASEPGSLDGTVDTILDVFDRTYRLDKGQVRVREALQQRFRDRGYDEARCRMLEVNLLGSLNGWMDFVLQEKAKGEDAVPDFARHLKRAFLSHCRARGTGPQEAFDMACRLASALMDVAAGFQKHMDLESESEGPLPPADEPS